MAVLVTGGAGYIGSHMALELIGAGETVIVLDDLSTGLQQLVPPEAKFYLGDVGDRALLTHIFNSYEIDTVFHFAGAIIVSDSVINPLEYYANNTVNSCTLLSAVVAHRIPHFIFSSTAAVYGVPDRARISEDTPLHPISPYGTSKLMTERMLADTAAAHRLRYCALRYFNVAGADPEGRSGLSSLRSTHLIKIACETAAGKRPYMQIFGTDYPTPDGTCIRDYVHVSDLAHAHWLALKHLRGGGESQVLNCGYGRGFSVREVIDMVKRVSGTDFDVRIAERRQGDPAELIASPEKIRAVLPWQPEFDNLEVIVRHALNWEYKLTGLRRAIAAE
jgi:UDP-glucose 4-epimerase